MPVISQEDASVSDYHRSGKRDAEGNAKKDYDDSSASSNGRPDRQRRHKIVQLNVGGKHYEVSRDTLERCKGSMLASLISSNWREGNSDDSEPIFIDRNGRLFEYVLDYLRTNKVHVPLSVSRSALQEELEYFGVDADMSQVIDMYSVRYLRVIEEKQQFHEARSLHYLREANAIKASVHLENKAVIHRLPPRISIPEEYRPFDLETLEKCSELRGLRVSLPAGNTNTVEVALN
jgi:hypothetical protein